MRILSVASSLPDHCYSQDAITAALAAYWKDKLRHRVALLERFHTHARVNRRHLAFPIEHYPELDTWGKANQAWFEVAEELGVGAIETALARTALTIGDIDALFVVSVTGIASPSLDARLINRMGLRSDIKRTPIFGLGCAAGAIGLSRAA